MLQQYTVAPSVQAYLDRLDYLVDQPYATKRNEQYVDTLVGFVLDHPKEGIDFARQVFPKTNTKSKPTQSRISTVEQRFRELYPTASFASFPATEDPNNVEAASRWLKVTVFPAVKLAWLMSVHKKAVYAGIWSVLKGQDDLAEDGDLSRDVDYLAYQVWAWAADNLESLFTEGTASISTRIRSKAWALARTWKTERLRHKARHVNVDADLIDKKAIVQAERNKASRLSDEARIISNPPKTRAMLCSICETVNGVSSTSGELSTLVCGHSRGLSIVAKDATCGDAAEQQK